MIYRTVTTSVGAPVAFTILRLDFELSGVAINTESPRQNVADGFILLQKIVIF